MPIKNSKQIGRNDVRKFFLTFSKAPDKWANATYLSAKKR